MRGHSPASLRRLVYKEFPEGSYGTGAAELAWLRAVGPRRAVEVVAATSTGYIMEELAPVERTPDLPDRVLCMLQEKIWPLDHCVGTSGVSFVYWVENMEHVFGIRAPEWIVDDARAMVGCCHGDPSLTNIMQDSRGQLRLIDPCHRLYVPETWAVDAGKVIQSLLGWEVVQAGWDPIPWRLGNNEIWQDLRLLRPALWWCGYHCHRILRREATSFRRPAVLDWAEWMRGECWGSLDR